MKKLIIVGVSLGVAVMCLMTIGLVFAFVRMGNMDAQGKEFADKILPLVLREWSDEELLKHVSPEFSQATTNEELRELFNRLRQLGKLKDYGGAKGQMEISFSINNGEAIIGQYAATAVFEAGQAEIAIGLTKRNGVWQVHRFHVESKALLPKENKEKKDVHA